MTRQRAKALCDYVRHVLSESGLSKPVSCKCDLCVIATEVLGLLDSIEAKAHVNPKSPA
jgi:hypothetical protein